VLPSCIPWQSWFTITIVVADPQQIRNLRMALEGDRRAATQVTVAFSGKECLLVPVAHALQFVRTRATAATAIPAADNVPLRKHRTP
jgi:hypothetical protein